MTDRRIENGRGEDQWRTLLQATRPGPVLNVTSGIGLAIENLAMSGAAAGVPLRQEVAVTGSVNQYGEVQAVGAVNEKIEGFFDVCQARGLTGRQGVVIPEANTRHLMLRRDVVEAVAAGRFHVYAITTVDEGLALLTGREAGERRADGRYPDGSFNAAVENALAANVERLKEMRVEKPRLIVQPSEDQAEPWSSVPDGRPAGLKEE